MARIFFAVLASGEIADSLRALGSTFRRRVPVDTLRFVDVGQAHFTLRFLGEQEAARVEAALLAGRTTARAAAAFDLSVETLGVFPDERRPHTLWVGVGRGASEIGGLARLLETELACQGFPPDERPFVPHMTIARVKQRPSTTILRSILAEPRRSLGTLRVESFALIESTPDKGGVRYITLQTFNLENPCTPSKSASTVAPKS